MNNGNSRRRRNRQNQGAVCASNTPSIAIACAASSPHIERCGRSETQTLGRDARPNRAQRKSGSNWTQGMPAGLPCGISGIGELIDGAMQQAAQRGRQSITKRGRATCAGRDRRAR